MKNIATTLVVLLTSFDSRGQDIVANTIRWNASTTYDVDKGEPSTEMTTITSYPDKIEWKAADGTLKYSFNIVKSNGVWTDISKDGQISYDLDQQGSKATIYFMRDKGEAHVRLLLQTQTSSDVFEITITDTQLVQ